MRKRPKNGAFLSYNHSIYPKRERLKKNELSENIYSKNKIFVEILAIFYFYYFCPLVFTCWAFVHQFLLFVTFSGNFSYAEIRSQKEDKFKDENKYVFAKTFLLF
jgi:hypothetical protein